jgi:hypothetical protein
VLLIKTAATGTDLDETLLGGLLPSPNLQEQASGQPD